MKTYRVETYGESHYTVSLDDNGVVDVDGLLPNTAENLKTSVSRHMERRNLSPIVSLGLVVGSYSTVAEVDTDPVPDPEPEPEV